ncbi:MAG: lycopene cyclase domain-containing protein [Chloroflexota bacterium]
MTYLQFVIVFLIAPIGLLSFATVKWLRAHGKRPYSVSAYSIPGSLVVISTIAFVYTTPWDNYLVAEKIWWYDPDKVLGVIGYVPIEEYAFFILQVILTGLAVVLSIMIFGRPSDQSSLPRPDWHYRLVSAGIVMMIWLIMLFVEQSGMISNRYLGLLLLWYLPPLALQLGFGADILWRNRLQIGATLLVTTTFLTLADLLAINTGIWTINPKEILGLHLFGTLPLEEALFFLVTNLLIVCGVPLCLAPQTWERIAAWLPQRPQISASVNEHA